MFNSERKRLYHIYWSLLRQFRFKKFLWVLCKVLGLFVNPLTAHNKYFFLTEAIYCNFLRCNYLRNEKYLLSFFFFFFLLFVNLDSNLIFLRNRMTVIADVFLNLRTPKDVFRYKSKKSRFRRSPQKVTWLKSRNTVQSLATASLPYLLIPVKAIQV